MPLTNGVIARFMTKKSWLLEARTILLSEDCYLREHDWHDFRIIEHLSKLPENVKADGEQFLSNPRVAWQHMTEQSPLHDSELAVDMIKGLKLRADLLCAGAPPLSRHMISSGTTTTKEENSPGLGRWLEPSHSSAASLGQKSKKKNGKIADTLEMLG